MTCTFGVHPEDHTHVADGRPYPRSSHGRSDTWKKPEYSLTTTSTFPDCQAGLMESRPMISTWLSGGDQD
jgi:hypothetical protein